MSTNTLQDRVADYLDYVGASKQPATEAQYRYVLEKVFLPWATIGSPEEVTDREMNSFTVHLKKKNLSPATIHSYIRSVRSFLGWCEVPKGKYRNPKIPKKVRDVLSRTEIDAMEAAADDPRDKLIVRVLAETGMRNGELLGLRPEDLIEGKYNRHYFLRIRDSKGHDERNVAISPQLYRKLKNFTELSQQDFIFNAKRRRDGDVSPLTRSGTDQLIRNLAKRAGIRKRVWPHLFRHSYATEMARKRVEMDTVRRQLGHVSMQMLQDVYSHITQDDTYDALINALR